MGIIKFKVRTKSPFTAGDVKSLIEALLGEVEKVAREDERKKISRELFPGISSDEKRKSFKKNVRMKSSGNGLGRGKGAKRDPKIIKQLELRFLNAVRAAPGSTIEYLAKQIDVPTKELQLPIKHLVEAGKIKKKGTTRAVEYFTSRQKA